MFETVMNLLGVPQESHSSAVTGFFSFIGLVFTGTFAVIAWLTREWKTRSEVRRDTMLALRSEIMSIWFQLLQYSGREEVRNGIRKKLEDGRTSKSYAPGMIQAHGISVYPALLPRISVLDEEVIRYIVIFYRQMLLIEEHSEHMRSAEFKSHPNDRKLAMLEDYWNSHDLALHMAKQSLDALDSNLSIAPRKRAPMIAEKLGLIEITNKLE